MHNIYVYIRDGRVTTSHWTDYKGEDLLGCLQEIEENEGKLRWGFGLVEDQVVLTAEYPRSWERS